MYTHRGGLSLRRLSLGDLSSGRPGLTPAYGTVLAEAASVCLASQSHQPGVILRVTGHYSENIPVHWPIEAKAALRAYADPEEATELAACGVAILLIEDLEQLTVMERARKGTGFDYWLGTQESSSWLFQGSSRLEVSGIRNGDDTKIKQRVRAKTKQINRSNNKPLPGYVIVVEFGAPRSEVVKA